MEHGQQRDAGRYSKLPERDPDPDSRFSEAQHRIANNLALIAGFVRLQASSVGRAEAGLSPFEARQILEEIGVRIETVGRLHRLLSLEAGVNRVDLGEFLGDTCRVLSQSFTFRASMDLVCDANACVVGPERAGLIGLIVTELVTNAVKYAHPAGAPGRIEVRCRQLPNRTLRLTVADDGVGLPEGFDTTCDGGLGLRVVRSLTRQLGGDLEFESECLGLTVRITVPPEELAVFKTPGVRAMND